jgi:hypothetical protein
VSLPQEPQPVKLVLSVLFTEEGDLPAVLAECNREFGPLDFVSEPLLFAYTDYYEKEMGSGLRRRIVSFRPLIPPEDLVEVKRRTNDLEGRHLNERKGRKVNIDPGILAASKFVLATGKDYTHRMYLGKGIYGDLTLMFRNGAFTALPWTYPDYGSEPLLGLLTLLRKAYLWQLKQKGQEGKRENGERENQKA